MEPLFLSVGCDETHIPGDLPAGLPAKLLEYRFKDTGGSRDTHETDTRTSQTNLKNQVPHPPTHAPDHTRTPGRTRRHTPHVHSPDQARWW